jgi:hypothetical protein
MKKIILTLSAAFLILVAFSQSIDDKSAKPTLSKEDIESMGSTRAPASSGVIFLDFEGLGNRDTIKDFYNGGTSYLGFSGPNYGVEFVDAMGLIDDDAGGTGNFANEPSPESIMYFPHTYQVVMNVAAGFTTGISFYYVSSVSGWVGVYDGLNGTGNLLWSVNLGDTDPGKNQGDPNGYYDSWYPVSFEFDGTAYSAVFIGGNDAIGFDNITIGATSHREVPLSDWALYLGIGLIVLLVIFRFTRYSRA